MGHSCRQTVLSSRPLEYASDRCGFIHYVSWPSHELTAHTDNGTVVHNITTEVPAHGVTVLLLKDGGDALCGLYLERSVW